MYKGFTIGSNYKGVCDVDFNFRTYFDLLVNKVSRMFVWENLPTAEEKEVISCKL